MSCFNGQLSTILSRQDEGVGRNDVTLITLQLLYHETCRRVPDNCAKDNFSTHDCHLRNSSIMATSSTASTATASTLAPPILSSPLKAPKDLRVAIVTTDWYDHIVDPLSDACRKELESNGVSAANIDLIKVPGAYELPFAASRLIETRRDSLHAVIVIGCMVKGVTMAYEFVSEAVAMGIMKLNVKTNTPVVLGLLTCPSEEEATRCAKKTGTCNGKACNHGTEWAHSAVELAHIRQKLAAKKCGDNCTCTNCTCDPCTCNKSS